MVVTAPESSFPIREQQTSDKMRHDYLPPIISAPRLPKPMLRILHTHKAQRKRGESELFLPYE